MFSNSAKLPYNFIYNTTELQLGYIKCVTFYYPQKNMCCHKSILSSLVENLFLNYTLMNRALTLKTVFCISPDFWYLILILCFQMFFHQASSQCSFIYACICNEYAQGSKQTYNDPSSLSGSLLYSQNRTISTPEERHH